MERWSLYGGLHKNGAEQRESITTGTIFLQNLTSRTVLLLLLLRAVRESLRAVPNTNVDNNERNKTRPVFETFAATTKLLPIYPFFFQNNRIESPIFARSRKSSAYYCINPLVPISFFFFLLFDFHSESREMERWEMHPSAAPSFPRLLSQPLGS